MDFVALDGEKKYKDKLNEVVAYEIGKSTSHTNEHVAFFIFPKQKSMLSWRRRNIKLTKSYLVKK